MHQTGWLSSLDFLTTGTFVLSWYVSGFIMTLWIIYDVLYVNTSVSKPLKVGWPIIVFFFSLIGLLLYLFTCRAPGTAKLKEDIKKKVHHKYVTPVFRKVTRSVIHCVAGDGLGIMTAMVIGRYMGLNFWSEFTGEYIAGFFFGWILFQYRAMRSMGNSSEQSLWKGGS